MLEHFLICEVANLGDVCGLTQHLSHHFGSKTKMLGSCVDQEL